MRNKNIIPPLFNQGLAVISTSILDFMKISRTYNNNARDIWEQNIITGFHISIFVIIVTVVYTLNLWIILCLYETECV